MARSTCLLLQTPDLIFPEISKLVFFEKESSEKKNDQTGFRQLKYIYLDILLPIVQNIKQKINMT